MAKDGVDINFKDSSGRTALSRAAEGGHEAVVKLLLEKAVDVHWVNGLRKVVFPNGESWEREDIGSYARMREIIWEARKGPKGLAER